MTHLGAVEGAQRGLIPGGPKNKGRMGGDGRSALRVHFVDGLRRRLLPSDGCVDSHRDEVIAGCGDLLADGYQGSPQVGSGPWSETRREHLVARGDGSDIEPAP